MQRLQSLLRSIDGRSYPAYKQIAGNHSAPPIELFIDHVQGDPFAAPSSVRLRIACSWPSERYSPEVRRRTLEDFLQRRVTRWINQRRPGRYGSGKSGLISISAPSQEVLWRSGVLVRPDWVEIRLAVGLPAAGRRVLGREAVRLLIEELPKLARETVTPDVAEGDSLRNHLVTVEDSMWLRNQIEEDGFVAFIPDGAILPRFSGIDPRPMEHGAKQFASPTSLKKVLTLPSGREITGMAIPRGVTLIVGGGYHGKSTLLFAIERGVYDHIPGDGREFCVTVPDAMRIRAEEGRRVASVDISSFIQDLPNGRSTSAFSTDDASGSTSQAAAIVEAIEVGTDLLLVDEDTAATNFMIRDRRMQLLVNKEQEPIVPFVDRVRELYDSFGISTILVLGGSGDYLDVADLVIAMREYEPEDITQQAREVAKLVPTGRKRELPGPLQYPPARVPDPGSIDPSRGRKSVAIKARRKDVLAFGREEIDLGSLSGPVELAQVRAIGDALHRLAVRHLDGRTTLKEALSRLEEVLQSEGLDVLRPFGAVHGDYAMPRTVDIAAALNRLRTLRISKMGKG